MAADSELYWYKAKYLKNHDGDTVTVALDLGFKVGLEMDVRLYGINTPEVVGASKVAGVQAKAFLEALLSASKDSGLLRMRSLKDKADKYGGRYLGELYLPISFSVPEPKEESEFRSAKFDPNGHVTNLNQLMIKAGHAKEYLGSGEKS